METDYFKRIRDIRNRWQRMATLPADDIEFLVARSDLVDSRVREAVDLLQQSRNAFRSKQVERARKILSAGLDVFVGEPKIGDVLP